MRDIQVDVNNILEMKAERTNGGVTHFLHCKEDNLLSHVVCLVCKCPTEHGHVVYFTSSCKPDRPFPPT